MEAITTKYLGPTNHRGPRIKATTASGLSVTIGYNTTISSPNAHRLAVVDLFIKHNLSGPSWGLVSDWRAGETKKGYTWVCCGRCSTNSARAATVKRMYT